MGMRKSKSKPGIAVFQSPAHQRHNGEHRIAAPEGTAAGRTSQRA